LCVGPVTDFAAAPDLERFGWRSGRNLKDAVHYDRFNGTADS
ncbi:MAG: 5,6-dimethylbenzimidazole synthase, partial [Mycobacteriaceae bacterium]